MDKRQFLELGARSSTASRLRTGFVIMPMPPAETPKVLIADDDDDARTLLSFRLEKHGLSVNCASNGEEAAWMLSMISPTLIITDFAMPGMSGGELVQMIASMPHLKNVPVIMVSGAAEDQVAAAVGSLNVVAFLSKGAAWPILRDVIDKCLAA